YTHTYYDLDGNRTEAERDEKVILRLDADFIEDTSIQNLTTPITAENIGELEPILTIYHAIDDTEIHWSSHESLLQIGRDLATITFADDGINLGHFQIRTEGYLNLPTKLHTAELDLEQCSFAWHGVLSHETNLLVVNCMEVMNIYDASTYAYIGTLPFIEPHSIEIDMAFRPDDAVFAVSTWNGIEFYGRCSRLPCPRNRPPVLHLDYERNP
ncbi:MAG: hypothetical protein KC496_05955, partial [Anaerolineae bacterium]|nr:hypothetical protein [Anaerolineae bacterium]